MVLLKTFLIIYPKIWQNSQENSRTRVSFLLNLQDFRMQLYLQESPAQVFSCKFCESFNNTFLKKTLQTHAIHANISTHATHTFCFSFDTPKFCRPTPQTPKIDPRYLRNHAPTTRTLFSRFFIIPFILWNCVIEIIHKRNRFHF